MTRLKRWMPPVLLVLTSLPMSCAEMEPSAWDDHVGSEIRKYQASQPEKAHGRPSVGLAGGETASRPASRPATLPAGPLQLTLNEAVLMSLENNQELAVERLAPQIQRTFEDQELALFDPILGSSLQGGRAKADQVTNTGDGIQHSIIDSVLGTASLSKFFPTGATVGVDATGNYTDSSLGLDRLFSSRLGLSATQALLNGYGTDVNLASVRQARLNTLASQYELRGFTEALVAQTQTTYWDYVLAERQIQIFTDSLALAQKQMEETNERIRIGKLGQTELAAVKAEVALRQEGLINARSNLATIRLRLLRLLNPPGDGVWQRQVMLKNQPSVPNNDIEDVESHVRVALRMRPEINQARLAIARDELELVKTRSGLLPRLDLFVTLGRTGYADSFGESLRNLGGDTYDVLGGVRFQYPLGNRDARARHSRATITRQQAQQALDNLAQLVQVDVRSAFIEIQRASEQVVATAATRKLQEETLRAETEKFRVDKSTSLLVAQAQRDLLAGQIGEVEALVTYSKAIINFYRLEGSLLVRRGISAPGSQPFVTSVPR